MTEKKDTHIHKSKKKTIAKRNNNQFKKHLRMENEWNVFERATSLTYTNSNIDKQDEK